MTEITTKKGLNGQIVYASRIPPRHMSASGQEFVAEIVLSNDGNASKWGSGAPYEVKNNQKEFTDRLYENLNTTGSA